jgi:hypothetical protein
LFYVVSDDAAWCEDHLSTLGDDVVFVGSAKPDQHGVMPFNSTTSTGEKRVARFSLV